MKKLLLAVVLCAIAPLAPPLGARVDPLDTRLLTQPAISASHIAFIYSGDLFVADRNGANVRRLTTDDGAEANPRFSPDCQVHHVSSDFHLRSCVSAPRAFSTANLPASLPATSSTKTCRR